MGRRSSGGRSFKSPARTSSPKLPKSADKAPPVPATAQSGIRSVVSSIADGIGWGFGASLANRCVDFLAGPRVIRVEDVSPTSAAPAPAPTTATNSVGGADACGTHAKAFQDCLNSSGSDIGKCQYYMDMLSQCRSSSVTA